MTSQIPNSQCPMPAQRMKALSIRQPWAGLLFSPPMRELSGPLLWQNKPRTNCNVVIGRKCIEVRTWQSFPVGMVRFGERIAIHASKTWDDNAPECLAAEARNSPQGSADALWGAGGHAPCVPLGGIIGTCILRGFKCYQDLSAFNGDAQYHLCPRMDATWWKDLLYQGKSVFGLVLTDPKIVPFFSCPGQLGFFEAPVGPTMTGVGNG